MSKVTEIRQRANQASEQARKVASLLRSHKNDLNRLIAQIQASIGDTATGADKESINYIVSVNQSIDDAVQSLERAASETRNWANRL